MNAEGPSTAPLNRRRLRARAVYAALVALFAVVLGGFFVGYWWLVRYERRALRHIPPQAVFAARIDVEQVVLFEPVRRHLFPLLNDLIWGESGVAEVQRLSGMKLSMDLRELMFAMSAERHWVLAIGGLLEAAKVEAAVVSVLNQARAGYCQPQATGARCGALSLGVSEDNILLLGSEGFVEQARPRSETYSQLGLNLETPATAAWNVASLTGGAGEEITSLLRAMGIQTVRAELVLSEPLRLSLIFTHSRPLGVGGVGMPPLLAFEPLLAGLPEAARAQLRILLRGATIEAGDTQTVVRTNWTRADMLEAFERLAFWIGQL